MSDVALWATCLAHLSQRLRGELIVYQSSRHLSVRPSTISNMNISEANRPIAIKFYLKQGEKDAWGFEADQFRTLISMATDSSHGVIMGKRRHHVFSNGFDRILFILAGKNNMHESLDEPDSTTDYRVSCP